MRNFGRTKSGKRVRNEYQRSDTSDSNERKEISRGEIADMRRHRHEQTERNDTIFDKKLYSEDSRFVSLQFQEAKL